ncbi:MAG: hypothetical protein NW208_15605 [Bryobacter sp.]|nr:hypothetical protein [Bryobacter sp.]
MNEIKGLGEIRSAEEALVERILQQPAFVRSQRLSAFLQHIVQSSWEGRFAELTEQQIGVRVFGRPGHYNPAEDNIVRSHARLLRQKLEAYFEAEGAAEPIRLEIPKGGYSPIFIPQSSGAPEVSKAQAKGSRRQWLVWGAGLSTVGLLAWGASRYWPGKNDLGRAGAFWQRLFPADRQTLIVAADAALVLVQDLTGQRITLSSYLNGEYRHLFKAPSGMTEETIMRIARRRYTGIVDVSLAAKLVAKQRQQGRVPAIRYARDLRFAELRNSNAIFLGAPHSNPWLELYRSRLNFWLDLEIQLSEFVVTNAKPLPGEAARYETKQKDVGRPVYALLSCQPGLDGKGSVLLLSGASIAGTESAAEFLLDDDKLEGFLRQAPREDWRSFELLLETNVVDGNSPQAKPIAWRFS